MKELIIKIKFWFIHKIYKWLLSDSVFQYCYATDVFIIRGQRISGAYFKMLEEVNEIGDIYELKREDGIVTLRKI